MTLPAAVVACLSWTVFHVPHRAAAARVPEEDVALVPKADARRLRRAGQLTRWLPSASSWCTACRRRSGSVLLMVLSLGDNQLTSCAGSPSSPASPSSSALRRQSADERAGADRAARQAHRGHVEPRRQSADERAGAEISQPKCGLVLLSLGDNQRTSLPAEIGPSLPEGVGPPPTIQDVVPAEIGQLTAIPEVLLAPPSKRKRAGGGAMAAHGAEAVEPQHQSADELVRPWQLSSRSGCTSAP